MKHIKNINIKNHIYFEDVELFFEKYNFLIGKNFRGKSLFLKSLQDNSLLDIPASPWNGDFGNEKNIFLINGNKRGEFYQKEKTFGYVCFDMIDQDGKNSINGFHPKDKISLTNSDLLKKIGNNDYALNELSKFHFLREKDILDNCKPHKEENNLGKPNSSGQNMSFLLRMFLLKFKNERDVFILDEPEIHIHPTAQIHYIDAVTEGIDNQFIISTHSPFLLKEYLNRSDSKIFVFRKNHSEKVEIIDLKKDAFPNWAKSYSAIYWYALDYPTEEFHNELYGKIQEFTENWNEKSIENFFSEEQRKEKSKSWIKIVKGKKEVPYDVTLSTYIRNSIHHPENELNDRFSNLELNESISSMIEIMNSLQQRV
jgi:hypothetical protein